MRGQGSIFGLEIESDVKPGASIPRLVGQLYLHGPDVAGPNSPDPNWPENVIYLGCSLEDWQSRIQKYGDEHSIAPGSIDESVDRPDEYRKLYRELNPGLTW